MRIILRPLLPPLKTCLTIQSNRLNLLRRRATTTIWVIRVDLSQRNSKRKYITHFKVHTKSGLRLILRKITESSLAQSLTQGQTSKPRQPMETCQFRRSKCPKRTPRDSWRMLADSSFPPTRNYQIFKTLHLSTLKKRTRVYASETFTQETPRARLVSENNSLIHPRKAHCSH